MLANIKREWCAPRDRQLMLVKYHVMSSTRVAFLFFLFFVLTTVAAAPQRNDAAIDRELFDAANGALSDYYQIAESRIQLTRHVDHGDDDDDDDASSNESRARKEAQYERANSDDDDEYTEVRPQKQTSRIEEQTSRYESAFDGQAAPNTKYSGDQRADEPATSSSRYRQRVPDDVPRDYFADYDYEPMMFRRRPARRPFVRDRDAGYDRPMRAFTADDGRTMYGSGNQPTRDVPRDMPENPQSKSNVYIYMPPPPQPQPQPQPQPSQTPSPMTIITTTTPRPAMHTPPRDMAASHSQIPKDQISRSYEMSSFSAPSKVEFVNTPVQNEIRRGFFEAPAVAAFQPLQVQAAHFAAVKQVSVLSPIPEPIHQPVSIVNIAPQPKYAVAVPAPEPEPATIILQQKPQPQVAVAAVAPQPETIILRAQQPQVKQLAVVAAQPPPQVQVVAAAPPPINIIAAQPAQQAVLVQQPQPLQATIVAQPQPVLQAAVVAQPLKTATIVEAQQAPCPPAVALQPVPVVKQAAAAYVKPQAAVLSGIPQKMATFFVPPMPQKTRTVYTQIQHMPVQTTVQTTTSYSPATKTTVYETDHVAAYSSAKPMFLPAPLSIPKAASFVYEQPKAVAIPMPVPVPVMPAFAPGKLGYMDAYSFPMMKMNKLLKAPLLLAGSLLKRDDSRRSRTVKSISRKQTSRSQEAAMQRSLSKHRKPPMRPRPASAPPRPSY